jgi:hypothetical protein
VNSTGGYTARWEVPLGATPGLYRFVVTANRYRLASHAFHVERSRRLTLTRIAAAPGKVALRLAYPQAVSHEAVGEPPGDFDADLTYRPQFAPTGTAVVSVNGRQRKVRARGGVFTFAAPAGATVVVARRAVRDRYGNANGDALTFPAKR